jgi:Asp-tRNA(Asn)/Glu-tRNA(Gln) amidotransferase A subunit family amidase
MKNLLAQSIVEKIKRKEISSCEATSYFIDKIEEVNPKINAVVVKRFNLGLQEARRHRLEDCGGQGDWQVA